VARVRLALFIPSLLAALIAAAPVVLPDTAQARTVRSHKQLAAFRHAHPCPSTGKRTGACPGWQIDHIKPLCAGGADKPRNMHWITVADHRAKTRRDVRWCKRKMARK